MSGIIVCIFAIVVIGVPVVLVGVAPAVHVVSVVQVFFRRCCCCDCDW